MKQKILLLVFSALCIAFAPTCQASADNNKNGTFSVDDVYTYLDTVKVVDCARFVVKSEELCYNGTSGSIKTVATKIIAVFSNDLMYSYVLWNDKKSQELSEKGLNHIYYIKKEGYVVVKVEMTPKHRKIVEFIGNIDAN